MNFTDYLFLPSVFICILAYFIVPLRIRWVVLLISSILFYCSWGIKLLPVALLSTGIVWIAGLIIERIYNAADQDKNDKDGLRKGKKKCRYILLTASGIIIAVLVFFKMQNILSLSIAAPLGISYYIMSLTGYLADVYWKKEKAESNYFKLLLFALYFPKILEGPISKHRLLASQLNEGHRFSYDNLCMGLQRILWGFFKKLIIADRLVIMVNSIFGNYESKSGSILVIGAISGAVQLYCDFSGCMDIALGISEIFGITMEENFKRPFFSSTAAEFWRRWHITLGIWFKDYIYMPLVISPKLTKLSGKIRKKAGKRVGRSVTTAIPLACVWILTGLWHGTGWNYIIWGGYWGVLIIISTVFEPEFARLDKKLGLDPGKGAFRIFRQVRTFCLFAIARMITLPGSAAGSLCVFGKIATCFAPWNLVDGTIYSQGLDRQNIIILLAALIILFLVSRYQERGASVREWLGKQNIVIRWAILLAGISAILIFGIYGAGYNAASFVYMGF